MTPRGAFLAVAGLVAVSVAAGVAAARLLPDDYPSANMTAAPERALPTASLQPALVIAEEPAPALRMQTFGALAPYAPLSAPFRPVREASLAPQPTVVPLALAEEGAPALTIVNAPLPPARPAELAGLLSIGEAPLPPMRPRDLVDAQAEPAPQAQPAPAPVVVASLGQTTLPQLEIKPPLAEPTPQQVEQAQPVDVPFRKGQQAYVRIFKQEGELELWLRKGAKFALYKTYPICKWSGRLGPKLREGDYQSPEGFYSVSSRQLNPNSNYHLAFNVGFPNALEKSLGYTGGLVMVHGDCKSVGCYAMTDKGIDEIYGFVAAALGGGQKEVPVNIFPFRMTDSKLARETGTGLLSFAPADHAQWSGFWRNLKEGYDLFEQTGEPPIAYACGGKYAFNSAGASCKRIAGWGI